MFGLHERMRFPRRPISPNEQIALLEQVREWPFPSSIVSLQATRHLAFQMSIHPCREMFTNRFFEQLESAVRVGK